MGRAARPKTPRSAQEEETRRKSEYRQRCAERDRAASAPNPHNLQCDAVTRGANFKSDLVMSLLLAVNDQLRLLGDVVVSLEHACDDAFEAYQGRVDDGDAALRDAVKARRVTKSQCHLFFKRFLVPILKRSVITFDGGEKQRDGEYVLTTGSEPKDVIPCDGRVIVSQASALFLHVDNAGKYCSLYVSAQPPRGNANMLYRGGDVEGEGDGVMTSIFDAVNRQLRLAELAHEVRDAHAWRDVIVTSMSKTPLDVLRARAPMGMDVVAANPHVHVMDDVALGMFVLNILTDEIGMRIMVFKGANRIESKPIRQLHPHVVKYSGTIMVSVEPSSNPMLRAFRSVTPRDAPSARSSEGDTVGLRQRNARDAETRNPGGRARRENTWRTSRHGRQPDAADAIRAVCRKMRDALLNDTMEVCEVCDEEDFRGDSNIREIQLTDAMKAAWVANAPAQSAHGHATRSNTPHSVRACKTCRDKLKNNKLPYTWKLWAPLRTVPPEVAGLNDLEFSLIAPFQCTATVYVANASGVGYVPENASNGASQRISKHNSFLFHRDVDASIERVLPRLPEESDTIFMARRNSARLDVVFPIRVDRTLAALQVLRRDNPTAYEGVRIDQERIDELRSGARTAREQGRNPDHAFDGRLTVVESDDVVDATFDRADASEASGTRSASSNSTYLHELEDDNSLRAKLAALLPQPRVPSVQHVNAALARGAPRLGEDTERIVNEFGDDNECILARSFLRLFYGAGGAAHVIRSRLTAAGFENEAKFSTEAYNKHLLRVYDDGNRRFQRDHQFLFYSFNAGNRREISQVSARLASNENVETSVVRDVADAINRDTRPGTAAGSGGGPASNVAGAARRLIKKLGMIMNPKRGSPTSTQRARNDVLTMINSPVCGRPALFITVNPSDTLWPELFRRVVGVNEERGLDKQQRRRIVAENPVLAARFFEKRLRLLMQHLMYGGAPVFGKKVVDHWYRIEFQFRGSPHAHCIFWLDGANIPDQVTSADHAALFELAELAGCSIHSKLPDGYDASGVRNGSSQTTYDPWDDYGGGFRPPKYQDHVPDMEHVARRDAIVDGSQDDLDADLYSLTVAFQQHACL